MNVDFEPVYDPFEKAYPDLAREAKAEGILFSPSTLMWIIKYGSDVCGCAGVYVRGTQATLKCLFVKKQYRGRGIQNKAVESRIAFIRKNYPRVSVVKANCTPASVNGHLRTGGEIFRVYKNKITEIHYAI